MRESLRTLPPGDRAAWSAAACAHIVVSPVYERAATVMVYLPMVGSGEAGNVAELDCTPLIGACHAAGKRVTAPRIDWGTRLMTPALLKAGASTWVRRHGVPEPPVEAPPVPVSELDLVVIPGVAFDAEGCRLGQGGGFYDRFLADLTRDTSPGLSPEPHPPFTVGLGFEIQLIPTVPAEPHDRRLDGIVTDQGWIRPPGGPPRNV